MTFSFPVHRLLILGVAALGILTPAVQAQGIGSDDFDSDSNAAWLADYLVGSGQLVRTNRHLEYRVSSPNFIEGDEAYRPWGLNQPPYSTDWEVLVDVHNTATPSAVDRVATFGIQVFNANNLSDYVYVEIYASTLYKPSLRRGFKADLALNGTELGENTVLGDTGNQGFIDGSVRMTFNSGTKVLTAWFDRHGNTNGYRWEKLALFGIAGSGGTTTNANWEMKGDDAFNITLYGYSQGMAVRSGEIYGDNFFFQTAATNRPALSASLASGGVRLRWPQEGIGYELVTSTTLTPGLWTNTMWIPDTVNRTNVLEVPFGSPVQFFRLRK